MPSRQGVNVSNNLKQTPIPVVSPRAQIVNGDGTVTRMGQLLLEQLQAATTIQGTHENRPDPGSTPVGALYVESDRGVLYYNDGSAWHYLAGTMWGTLSPDQRPTDLGVDDAGFEFRSIDTNADLAPREFIWSQSEWIETTLVMYGTHANRPAADEKTPPRTLYVEEDRGNVIYQQQADKWMYLAGTMRGTFSPDQRPTDLGVNDAGFDFRTTDDPAREFIWSQTEWIEVTPVRYGTHAQRLAVAVAGVIDQMLWVETDRGDVTYQTQANTWHYIAGAMLGTLSPDQRPTDLGANDVGFRYSATDQTAEFYWSGSAWVGTTPTIPPAGDYEYVIGTATLTLTTTATPIPGVTLTLPRAGVWAVRAFVDLTMQPGDAGAVIIGGLTVDGAAVSSPLIVFAVQSLTGSQVGRSTLPGEWLYTAPASGHVLAITAYKTGGTGTSACTGTNSSLSATWIHA